MPVDSLISKEVASDIDAAIASLSPKLRSATEYRVLQTVSVLEDLS